MPISNLGATMFFIALTMAFLLSPFIGYIAYRADKKRFAKIAGAERIVEEQENIKEALKAIEERLCRLESMK